MKHPRFRGEVFIHVLPPSGTLMDGRKARVGRELKAKTDAFFSFGPELCHFGMHAICGSEWYPLWWTRTRESQFKNRFYAIPAMGNWVCVVKVWGKTERDAEKIVGLRRKVIAMKQITTVNEIKHLWQWGPSSKETVDWVIGDAYLPKFRDPSY